MTTLYRAVIGEILGENEASFDVLFLAPDQQAADKYAAEVLSTWYEDMDYNEDDGVYECPDGRVVWLYESLQVITPRRIPVVNKDGVQTGNALLAYRIKESK